MVATREEEKIEKRKGFAGLSALVSDVDESLPPPTKQKAETSDAPSQAQPPAVSESQPPEPPAASERQPPEPQRTHQPHQVQPQQPPGSSEGKWMLGIAAVFGVLWLIGGSYKSPSSPAPSYSPPASSTMSSYSTAPTKPPVPKSPDETKPPVGQDLILSNAQIRYCLAEEIRIDAAEVSLNNFNELDVNKFNAMVADFNSRCGRFRYRNGALESVRREVEPYRSQLQAEGRSRFASGQSAGYPPERAQTPPVPDATVLAVQKRLNEIGYNAGPADGFAGPRTRSAITAFQRDQGIYQSGLASEELLSLLQRANVKPRAPTNSSTLLAVGMHSNNVLRVQGTPDDIIRYPSGAEEWIYGNSRIRMSPPTGQHVESWMNRGELTEK